MDQDPFAALVSLLWSKGRETAALAGVRIRKNPPGDPHIGVDFPKIGKILVFLNNSLTVYREVVFCWIEPSIKTLNTIIFEDTVSE